MEKVPVSHVYSNESKQQPSSSSSLLKFNQDGMKETIYFFLVFYVQFTQEEIDCCNGKRKCYNCNNLILHRIFFAPESHINNTFGCFPFPHCRKACARRTIEDLPNHCNYITYFTLMHGVVLPAPPRCLLYLGVEIDVYHKMIDDNILVQQETSSHVRSVLCPVYISTSFMLPNYTMPKEAVLCSDGLSNHEECLPRETVQLPN